MGWRSSGAAISGGMLRLGPLALVQDLRFFSRELGVSYHPAHVSRLLRRLAWSVQKPIQRASQRDEAAIAAWQTERWPALKKKPQPKAARSSG